MRYDPHAGLYFWLCALGPRSVVGHRAGFVDKSTGYRYIRIHGKRYAESTLAVFYMTARWPVRLVDHKNTIRDDNSWRNLRLASPSQNNMNTRGKVNATGFKGVSQHGSTFRAQIKTGKKRLRFSGFRTPKAAHVAYLAAAKHHFGEFARG